MNNPDPRICPECGKDNSTGRPVFNSYLCEECYAKEVYKHSNRLGERCKEIPGGKTISEAIRDTFPQLKQVAKPLWEETEAYKKFKESGWQKAKDYATNTEFTCHLGGGDPKATIFNLRSFAYSAGYDQGIKDAGEAPHVLKNNALIALNDAEVLDMGTLKRLGLEFLEKRK